MIIAYKAGKWNLMIAGRMFPRDYSNCGLGLDVDAKIFQYSAGVFYFRWKPKKTHVLDIPQLVLGRADMVWQQEGPVVTYRFKDQLFRMQRLGRYEHRKRRTPALKRIQEDWWAILDVDGAPIAHPVFMYQKGDDPLIAMDGYVRMTKMFKVQPGAEKLTPSATYLM